MLQLTSITPYSFPVTPGHTLPWTFVTGLPPSDGNTIILTIVEHFSKDIHFVPLTKRPSALETFNLLVTHVFCHHGISQDTVSGVSNLPRRCGGCSDRLWGPRSVYQLDIIPRLMARQSGQTSTWSPPCVVWLEVFQPLGPHICCGLNMPTIP